MSRICRDAGSSSGRSPNAGNAARSSTCGPVKIELRHAAIGSADAKELAELPAVLVLLYQRRSRQVRAAGAATGGRAVAEPAFLSEQLTAALDRGRVEPGAVNACCWLRRPRRNRNAKPAQAARLTTSP